MPVPYKHRALMKTKPTSSTSRITKVTTRNGDSGQTRLGNNAKVSKADPLIRALGSADELNSALGLLRCHIEESGIDIILSEQQQLLFDVGGVLAMLGEYNPPAVEESLAALSRHIEQMNDQLPPLTEFVIPGGSLPTAQTHLCRTICRRAETDLWAAIDAWQDELTEDQTQRLNKAGACLNRLSDFFFVLARTLQQDQAETQWRGPAS